MGVGDDLIAELENSPVLRELLAGEASADRRERALTPTQRRNLQEPIGGYAYQAPIYEPTPFHAFTERGRFDAYQQRDLRRILGRMVNLGTVSDLQLSLIQAGLLNEDSYASGLIDSATSEAFSTILALANQNGMDWRDVLSQAAAGGGIGGNASYGAGVGGGQEALPNIVTLPNREDIKATQEQTFMDMTGDITAVDDDLLDSAADHLLDILRTQQERQFQQTLSATAGAGETDTVFVEGARGADADSMTRLLEEEVRSRDPGGVAEQKARELRATWFEGMAGPI